MRTRIILFVARCVVWKCGQIGVIMAIAVTACLLISARYRHPAFAATSEGLGVDRPLSDWPVYGGQAAGDHYSPLSQINRTNVHQLKEVWRFDTQEEGGLETSPIIVGKTLYAYSPSQKVIALDGASGKLLWKFDAGVRSLQPARGLAYWTDGKDQRLLAGVVNFLYAIDPATGRPIESFGENGRIDLRKELRGDYSRQPVALTTPGIIYKDVIIVGFRTTEAPPAPPGDIRAYEVKTGKLRWSFHTIPHPGEFGYDTWPTDAWQTSGAANNWAGMALDSARGIVYVPTGSAVFDYYGGDRPGNNLFADTLLALDASTGKRLWHFQGVHHDTWDRDFPSPPALLTIHQGGKNIDAIAQTTKQGFVYLFDRVTGKPLFPIEEKNFLSSNVPGEKSSPTQPRPLIPEPFARQLLTEDMLTTRSPVAHSWAVDRFRTFRSEGQFVPLSVDKQTVVFPGLDGGAEWGGPAVEPTTGIIYINANDLPWTLGLVASKAPTGLGSGTYQNQCSSCHGEDRKGSPPAFPSLIDVDKRLSPSQIADTIHGGKGRMPSYPNIQGAQLEAILHFLKTGNDTEPSASTGTKSAGQAVTKTDESMSQLPASAAGADVYRDKCAVCHSEDRAGIPPAFPTLIGIGQRLTSQQITDIVHNGKGRMPPFAKLSDADLSALLQYLRLNAAKTTIAPAPIKKEMDPIFFADSVPLKYRVMGYGRFLDPDGYPAVVPPWGTLNAIDLNTGKYVWKIPLGEYPELASKGVKDTGTENYGGPIVTKGGLVIISATVYDRKIRAFDTATGELLWQSSLPFAGVATPATYMIGGKQYVVIATGGGRDPKAPSGGVYVAFALP